MHEDETTEGIVVSWDPLTLSFSNAELERQYAKHQERTTFSYRDGLFSFFVLVNTFAVLAVALSSGRSQFEGIDLLNSLQGLGVVWMMKRRRHWYLKNRTTVVLIQRGCRIAAGVRGMQLLTPEVSEWTAIIRLMFFYGCCTLWCWGLPVMFKVHVVMHVVMMVPLSSSLQPWFCTRQALWTRLNGAISLRRRYPERSCNRIFVVVLLIFGLVLPSYIVWESERKSRMRYLMDQRIPLHGTINGYYMGMVLMWMAVSVWFMMVFDI